LPPLRHLLAFGTLDPEVTLAVRATADDEVAARNLADIVRGFVALLALAQQKPALAGLAQAVVVEARGRETRLDCRLTEGQAEGLVQLVAPGPKPAPAAPPPPEAGRGALVPTGKP
jgi:hypothetical protein